MPQPPSKMVQDEGDAGASMSVKALDQIDVDADIGIDLEDDHHDAIVADLAEGTVEACETNQKDGRDNNSGGDDEVKPEVANEKRKTDNNNPQQITNIAIQRLKITQTTKSESSTAKTTTPATTKSTNPPKRKFKLTKYGKKTGRPRGSTSSNNKYVLSNRVDPFFLLPPPPPPPPPPISNPYYRAFVENYWKRHQWHTLQEAEGDEDTTPMGALEMMPPIEEQVESVAGMGWPPKFVPLVPPIKAGIMGMGGDSGVKGKKKVQDNPMEEEEGGHGKVGEEFSC